MVGVGYRITQKTSRSPPLHGGNDPDDYELVHDSSILQSDDGLPTIMIEDYDTTQSRKRKPEPRSINHYVLLACITTILWTGYAIQNSRQQVYPRVDTRLDRKYVPAHSLEVIISMYKEPVAEVAEAISHMKGHPGVFRCCIYNLRKG